MTTKRFGRFFLVVAAIGTIPLAALADEIVHFTNGAEMTVLSHSVDKSKEMVRLELGGNSFIAFPMAMVDKIVSAGQNVFLNPGFHPSNQAISGGAFADNSIRGTGDPSGLVHRPAKGTAGVMLGEVADALPAPMMPTQPGEQPVASSRRIFNPAFPSGPGEGPQVIMPPGKARPPIKIMALPTRPQDPLPPPVSTETQDNPPASDPPPENQPDTP